MLTDRGRLFFYLSTKSHLRYYVLKFIILPWCLSTSRRRYELNTSTYGFIVPEKCSHCIVSCGVKATLRKQGIGSMWTRFIQSPLKQPWLTRDFDYWLTNNSSDDEEQLEPIVDASTKNLINKFSGKRNEMYH